MSTLAEHAVPQNTRTAMQRGNKLKLGLFSANASNGRFPTKAPERWMAGWEENRMLAVEADAFGMDFLLPVGRWKGYGGETDHQGTTFETITWATGLLAVTKQITVFGTVHVPLFHPVIAAKQMVTADHVGSGRFGLNVVCGWNEDEFDMFGVTGKDHAGRYRQGQEWLDVITAMWTREDEFDFDGEFYHMRGVKSKPKPFGGSRPIIMNAGASAVGKAFAIRNCDAYFTGVRLESIDDSGHYIPAIDAATEHVRQLRAEADAAGRTVGIYTRGEIVCRPTQQEAEDFYHYAVEECADWGAVDYRLKKTSKPDEDEAEFQRRRRNHIHGFPITGTPDVVAALLARVSNAGFDGIALGLVSYLNELPYFCSEVLPRLEKNGLT